MIKIEIFLSPQFGIDEKRTHKKEEGSNHNKFLSSRSTQH